MSIMFCRGDLIFSSFCPVMAYCFSSVDTFLKHSLCDYIILVLFDSDGIDSSHRSCVLYSVCSSTLDWYLVSMSLCVLYSPCGSLLSVQPARGFLHVLRRKHQSFLTYTLFVSHPMEVKSFGPTFWWLSAYNIYTKTGKAVRPRSSLASPLVSSHQVAQEKLFGEFPIKWCTELL